MLVATVILVVGDKTVGYTHKAPQGSILTQVFGAIGKNTNSILPKMKSVLPTMKSVLPTIKSVLPTMKSVLSKMKSVLPTI